MALTPNQLAMARLIMRLGAQRGLAPNRQRELVAAAYAESGLNPKIYNRAGSGAAGLFQLLSSGYVNTANRLGGVLSPKANTLAILPSYISYWKKHPGAAPGEAARDVEISGEGAGFYSRPLSLIPKNLAAPGPAGPPLARGPRSVMVPGAPIGFGPETIRQFDPGMLSQGIFSGLLSGETPDISALVGQSYKNVRLPGFSMPGKPRRVAGPPPLSDASPPPFGRPVVAVTPKNVSKWALAGSGMDRSGMKTNPAVFKTVARIAQIYGSPLRIGTGSNHNEYVKGSNRRSDHWFGEAADIPMTGAALTRLGQAALIMAGMSPTEARKQRGGVFNIGGFNILFNTNVGGNHFNHLHVGMGRIIGRPA